MGKWSNVYLRVTVASHGHDMLTQLIEPVGNGLGVEPLRDTVARTIIEDVAQQAQHVTLLAAIVGKDLLQSRKAAMYVGYE